MIKKHIQSLVACLFNVILHLQGNSIFNGYVDSIKAYQGPNSGSVILMCIEILTKISGKPSFFQIDACHIAESLRVPGALFQYFLQLQTSEAPIKASGISTSNSAVDRTVSIELYAACCRMLCTALKHHKRCASFSFDSWSSSIPVGVVQSNFYCSSMDVPLKRIYTNFFSFSSCVLSETRQCMALLEDSISVLLHCLEIVNTNRVAGKEFFAWEVQEAVICASSLRRVYEEVCFYMPTHQPVGCQHIWF